MNKIDDYLMKNFEYELTDSKFNFHLNPSETSEVINLGIEFFYANVEQFFEEKDFTKFSYENDEHINLPVKALVYFAEESIDADMEEVFLCESEFIGNIVFRNKDSENISKNQFNDFIINNKHQLSSKIWTSIREIFNLFVQNKKFPPIPMELSQ